MKVVCEFCGNEFETKYSRTKQCDKCMESEDYTQSRQDEPTITRAKAPHGTPASSQYLSMKL